MQRIILAFFGLLLIALALNCGGTSTTAVPGNDTPTEAYKRLFAAVKAKDIEAIKKQMSAKSIEFASMAAARNKTPIEKVFENGYTGTTFSPTLPELRDERIAGDEAGLEVWNSKDSRWEDLPFVKEDGVWKLAVGDLFAGTYKPEDVGHGRAFREAEAANAAGKGPVQAPGSNVPANFSLPPSAVANANVPQPPPAANKGK
ncbi:MAG: hypothetical protein ABJA02_01390 [Acidobacteriota bacterium]